MWHTLIVIGCVVAGVIVVALIALIALAWTGGDAGDSTGGD